MNKAGLIGLVFTLVVVCLMLIVVNLPFRLFAGDLFDGVEYTDLEGSSLVSGNVWVNMEGVQGPVHVIYHWCPGWYPGRWCVEVDHASVALETMFVFRGLDIISLQDTQIVSVDLQALGVAGGLVSGRVSGEVAQLDWRQSNCPLMGVERIQGRLMADNLGVFGAYAGEHRLDIATVGEGIDMNLEGDTFSGSIEIRDDQYAARGELIAPESMITMASSLMRSLGGNRFGWEISGRLPC